MVSNATGCGDYTFSTEVFNVVAVLLGTINILAAICMIVAMAYLGKLQKEVHRYIFVLPFIDILHLLPFILGIDKLDCPSSNAVSFLTIFSQNYGALWQITLTFYFYTIILNFRCIDKRIYVEIFSYIIVFLLSGIVAVVDYVLVLPKEARIFSRYFLIYLAAIIIFIMNINIILYIKKTIPKDTKGKWTFYSMLLWYSGIYIIVWLPYGITKTIDEIQVQHSGIESLVGILITSFSGLFHAIYYGYTRNIWSELKGKCLGRSTYELTLE